MKNRKFEYGDRLVVTANHLAAGTEVKFLRRDISGRALVELDDGQVTDVLFAALKKAEPKFKVGDRVRIDPASTSARKGQNATIEKVKINKKEGNGDVVRYCLKFDDLDFPLEYHHSHVVPIEETPEFEVGDSVKIRIGWENSSETGKVTHFLQGSDGKRKFIVALDEGGDALYPPNALKKLDEPETKKLLWEFDVTGFSGHDRAVADCFRILASTLVNQLDLEDGPHLRETLSQLQFARDTALTIPRKDKS